MSSKPTWDDAPDGAQILIQNANGSWRFGSFKSAEPNEHGAWNGLGCGEWLVPKTKEPDRSWEDSLERRPFDNAEVPDYD